MKILATFSLLLLICTPVAASPALSIEEYCRELTKLANAGYSFEESCRKNESKAAREMAGRKIPSEIENYCTELTNSAEAGYSFLWSCIKQETKAKENLGYR